MVMVMKKFACYLLVLLSFSLASCQNGSNDSRFSDDDVNVQPGTQEDLDTNVGNFVLFEFNEAKLTDDAVATLNKQSDWLKAYPYINIVVWGLCDERGTREYNLALGAKRANSVKEYLVSTGIKADRIATISYGKERPVVLGSNPEAWRQNRRAAVIINN